MQPYNNWSKLESKFQIGALQGHNQLCDFFKSRADIKLEHTGCPTEAINTDCVETAALVLDWTVFHYTDRYVKVGS